MSATVMTHINDLPGWLRIQRDQALSASEHASTIREGRYHRGQYDAFCAALRGVLFAQPGGASLEEAHRSARESEAPSVL